VTIGTLTVLFGGSNGNCPSNAGPDYDFGSAPEFDHLPEPHGPKTILGAGQKSGIYFALIRTPAPNCGARR
jgi:polyvinyl alcohol dehydrogenase (cytochrome)